MGDLYSAKVDNLFSKSTTNNQQVYVVDEYLADYTAVEKIDQRIVFAEFVVPIISVAIAYEAASDVDNLVGNTDASYKPRLYANPAAAPSCAPVKPPGCPQDAKSPPPPGPPPPPPAPKSDGSFDGDIDKVDVALSITTGGARDLATAKKIMAKLKERMTILGQIITSKRGSSYDFKNAFGSSGTHDEFAEYMMQVNMTIGSFYFEDTYKKISDSEQQRSVVNITDPVERRKIQDADRIRLTAIANLKSMMVPWRFEPLTQALRKASKRSIEWMITKESSFSALQFIKSFSSRSAMATNNTSTNQYYYKMRSTMYDFFVMDKTITQEDDNKILLFMKKLIVDMYIKTCYPLIHYDMLDTIMMRNIRQGNFINARFALAAKCALTAIIVIRINEFTAGDVESTDTANTISGNIKTYISRNNKGDITSNDSIEQQMTKILTDLHKLSNGVAQDSGSMVILQKAIADNQLTMRTVSSAIENRKKDIELKVIEFWIVFSVMIATITACGVLYFFEFVDIGLMVAAGVLGCVLVYLLIMMIVSFVRKN